MIPPIKIGLGTVQFGLDYGVSNQQGITPIAEVKRILALSWNSGVTILDTAVSYGASEEVIGQNISEAMPFKIVTKTPFFRKDHIDQADAARLKETFLKSLIRLKQTSIYGLLVHHADDLLVTGGFHLWQQMEALKASGIVNKIGVSVYSPSEIEKLLRQYRPDLIQLPLNVFDQRMIKGGYLRHLKGMGIEIHSRSVFLQGLLLMSAENLLPYFNNIKPILKQYHTALQKQCFSPLTAALSFVYLRPEIDYVIVGVNNHVHLEEIINVVHNVEALRNFDYSDYAVNEEFIINPSMWRLQ